MGSEYVHRSGDTLAYQVVYKPVRLIDGQVSVQRIKVYRPLSKMDVDQEVIPKCKEMRIMSGPQRGTKRRG